jgi:phage gp29-like protein
MWPFARQRQPAPVVTESSLAGDPLPALPLWSQFTRIGGNLTPLSVTAILQEADGGRPARLVDLFHECRQKDCHLQSVMASAESDITSLEWMIAPPKDATPAEEDCASAFAEAWEKADKEAGVAHLVGESMGFGFAFGELDWEMVDGKLVPVTLRPVACRRFGFRQSDGALLFDMRNAGSADYGGVDLTTAYPGKFVSVKRRINGDVLIREGLARCLVWAALGRNWTLKDWLTLGEIGFKPSTIGIYKKGSSKVDVAHLADVIERFSATGKATIPETLDVRVEWPRNSTTGGGGVHKELQEYLGAEMSKAVLHGTMTVEAGTRGARSLGEVHDKGRDGVRDTNARIVCDALTRGPAATFAAVNYGPNVRPPRVVLATEDQVDLEKFGKALAQLRTAGLRKIPASWVRDQAGIPEAVGDEETLDVEVTEEGFGPADTVGTDSTDTATDSE